MLHESHKKILGIHVIKGIELQGRNASGDEVGLETDFLELLSGQLQATNLMLNDILYVLEEISSKRNST